MDRPVRRGTCPLTLSLEAVRGRVWVILYCGDKNVGEMSAFDVAPQTLASSCRESLQRLSKRVGFPLDAYVVHYARIPPRFHGMGIGTAMYLAAAEGASRLNGALVQHRCFHDDEEERVRGTTSAMARRVWRGNRFRDHTEMSGGAVAYMPEDFWGTGATMLQFGQVEVGYEPVPNPEHYRVLTETFNSG